MRRRGPPAMHETLMAGSVVLAIVMSVATWLLAMRSGVRALEDLTRA